MKQIILTTILFIVCIYSYCQTQSSYQYDASGNRISKVIILLPVDKSAPVDKEESEEEEQPEDEFLNVYSETFEKLDVNIYPNPTYGRLTVELKSEETLGEITLSVYSINGQRIYFERINTVDSTNRSEVDLTGHKSGVYVMKIETVNSTSEWKIIKQ